MNSIGSWIFLFIKGAAMGAANVIPGVSGGTVAFITGIYERLINALKSIDHHAVGHLLRFRFREFAKHVDLLFLVVLGLGVLLSIVSLAKLLEWLFANHERLVLAFFFGLILASIYFVGKLVKRWSIGPIAAILIGAAIAVGIGLLPPASENTNFFYLLLCGVAAVSSMIIPGISGSFVLLLMGNYLLILGAISGAASDPGRSIKLLIPFGIGVVAGLLVLSHVLSWLFKRYHDIAVALMTGFVAGSLYIIWPWKYPDPDKIIIKPGGEEKIIAYIREAPDFGSAQTWFAIGLIVIGAALVWLLELTASKDEKAAA